MKLTIPTSNGLINWNSWVYETLQSHHLLIDEFNYNCLYENISISDKYICFGGGQIFFIVVEPYRFFKFCIYATSTNVLLVILNQTSVPSLLIKILENVCVLLTLNLKNSKLT